MAKLNITRRAEVDLLEIWIYVAERNYSSATPLIERLKTRCQDLADWPGLGSKHPSIQDRARLFSCDGYLIVYAEIEGGIEVLRVLHGSRDWATIFREEP